MGNQVRILGRALVREGHKVTVIALAQPGLPVCEEDEGVQVHRVQPAGLHWYASKIPVVGPLFTLPLRELEYAWAGYRQVHRLHRQTPFDLIEGTETGALGVALGLPKIPLIIRLHGERYTFYKYTPGLSLAPGLRISRALQRMAIRRAELLISPSLSHAEEISEELRQQHPPIEVIPNCIDMERWPVLDNTKRDPAMILYVGRLEMVKGVLLLLEAAGSILHQKPDAHFVLAGAPHPTVSRSQIDTLLNRYGLHEKVQILGHVRWEEILTLYQRAAICVIPSYYETFGLAALEALALGCSVVVTAAGALPEVVKYSVGGHVTQVGDANSLADLLIRLLRNGQVGGQRTGMGASILVTDWSVERLIVPNLQLFNRAIVNC